MYEILSIMLRVCSVITGFYFLIKIINSIVEQEDVDVGIIIFSIIIFSVTWAGACIVNDFDASPYHVLGRGFANQTCIDQGQVLKTVTSVDGLPNIVCEDVVQKHIDGVKYTVNGVGKVEPKTEIRKQGKINIQSTDQYYVITGVN